MHNAKTVLYCIDTKADSDPNIIDGYDWIAHDQIQWYLDTAVQLRRENNGKPMPALAFFHIPLPEYNDVWDANTCVGSKYETVCCPKINSGFFSAMLQAGDVMGTFVGHDHDNDFAGIAYGICFAYGRGTGYDTYGKMSKGGRVIELFEGKREFTSWIRTEENKILHKINFPKSFK